MPKNELEKLYASKINLIEDENIFFEDINEYDKYAESIDNREE